MKSEIKKPSLPLKPVNSTESPANAKAATTTSKFSMRFFEVGCHGLLGVGTVIVIVPYLQSD